MGQSSSKTRPQTGIGATGATEAHEQTSSGPNDPTLSGGSDPPENTRLPAASTLPKCTQVDSRPCCQQSHPKGEERRSTESTEAHLDPITPTNSRADTTVGSGDETPSQSPGERFSSPTLYPERKRVLRQASFTVPDTEFCHPSTLKPVYHRRSITDRSALRIVDPTLINAIQCIAGSDTVLQGRFAFDGVFLSPAASIHEPYEMLFYNRDRIAAVGKKHTDDEIGQHAQFVLSLMKNERSATWEKAVELDQDRCYSIAFEDSWLLYPPGETVFRRDPGGWRAYKVARIEVSPFPSSEPIRVYGYYLGFGKGGRSLVPRLEILEVASYPSEKTIESLDVVPQRHFERAAPGFREMLMKRGKHYWKYRDKTHHMQYRGDAWPVTVGNSPCRVIIDYATASGYERELGNGTGLSQALECFACLGEALQLGPYPSELSSHDAEVCPRHSVSVQHCNNLKQELGIHDAPAEKYGTAKDDLLMYCPSLVSAFSLQHQIWAQVKLDDLDDVQPDDKGWKQVLMNYKVKKDMEDLDTAVSSFRSNASPGLVGKRRGLHVHLSGGPGTGKTFTAESLACKYPMPLYQINCSSFGTEPRTLDRQLRRIFQRSADWGAMLLLEDADALLQVRSTREMERSSLASVFLNWLDVSDALVFMTTSMGETLDKSLEARIHISLPFPDLSLFHQKQVWQYLLSSVNFARASLEALEHFINESLGEGVKEPGDEQEICYMRCLNGRQIESCFRAALTLAVLVKDGGKDAVQLEVEELKKILRLGSRFRKFMANDSDYMYTMDAAVRGLAGRASAQGFQRKCDERRER